MARLRRPPVRLTARGVSMLVGAGVAAIAAYLVGWPALLTIAVFLAAVVIVGCVVVFLGPMRFTVDRRIEPPVAQPGVPSDVFIAVSGTSGPTEWHETVVSGATIVGEIGGRLPSIRPGDPPIVIEYAVAGAHRGELPLGPLRIDRVDPFGVAIARRTLGDAGVLTVLPTVHAVSPPVAHVRAASDPAESSSAGMLGDHRDVIAREYRPGDAMRNVDWRSTARRGELMVRAETAVVATSTAVLLDTRASVWPDVEHFEWAVEVAASLLASAAERRTAVVLVVDAFQPPPLGLDAALLTLAKVGFATRESTVDGLVHIAATTESQVVHVITGPGAEHEVLQLPRPTGGAAGLVSIVRSPGGHAAAPPGWRLAELDPERSVDEAWQAHD